MLLQDISQHGKMVSLSDMASNRVIAGLSVGGVIGGIALTIYLTQTLLSPLIESAQWFPDNGLLGIGC